MKPINSSTTSLANAARLDPGFVCDMHDLYSTSFLLPRPEPLRSLTVHLDGTFSACFCTRGSCASSPLLAGSLVVLGLSARNLVLTYDDALSLFLPDLGAASVIGDGGVALDVGEPSGLHEVGPASTGNVMVSAASSGTVVVPGGISDARLATEDPPQ